MSPLMEVSALKISTTNELTLSNSVSNCLRAGTRPFDAHGGTSNQSASSAQCFVLCSADIDLDIPSTIERIACLSCSIFGNFTPMSTSFELFGEHAEMPIAIAATMAD